MLPVSISASSRSWSVRSASSARNSLSSRAAAKARERRVQLNGRIELLERRIEEMEKVEVAEMVRTANVTPEQLAVLLKQAASAPPNPATLEAAGATFDNEEDTDESME